MAGCNSERWLIWGGGKDLRVESIARRGVAWRDWTGLPAG